MPENSYKKDADEPKYEESMAGLDSEIDFEALNQSLDINWADAAPSTLTPAHSLEPNLILVFIYAAAVPFAVAEFDVLRHAQRNTFGYLSAFHSFTFLKRSFHVLRPINVPFKNKWIRDTYTSVISPQAIQAPPMEVVMGRLLEALGL